MHYVRNLKLASVAGVFACSLFAAAGVSAAPANDLSQDEPTGTVVGIVTCGPDDSQTPDAPVTVGVTAAVCWAGAGAGTAAVEAGGMIDAIGAGAALAADGAITAASDGTEIDRSRSASWRSTDLQSVRPELMAPRPSIT